MSFSFTPYQKKFLTLSSLGGALEFYDFVIFVFFAKIIGQSFFPAQDPLASLMETFAVFAIGYIVRPLGGILFAHFGDKRGRKTPFVASVFLMAVPTFCMGLLPTYQTIGISASFLLVLLRILQGLSIGGEIPGALVFVSESVPAEKRGQTCGILFFGYLMGLFVGSSLSTYLSHHLPLNELSRWGWRIPFLFGGLLGVVSFYLRRGMQETPVFQQLVELQGVSKRPFWEVITTFPGKIFTGIGIVLSGPVSVVLFYLFMPTYLSAILHYPMPKVLFINACSILLYSVFVALGGRWSDTWGRRPIMISANLFIFAFSYLGFYLLPKSLMMVALVLGVFSIAIGLITACFATMITELFSTRIRFSGIAISYNLGFAIFGGLTPLIATTLIRVTHSNVSPSFYLMLCTVFTLIATVKAKEGVGQMLESA